MRGVEFVIEKDDKEDICRISPNPDIESKAYEEITKTYDDVKEYLQIDRYLDYLNLLEQERENIFKRAKHELRDDS